MGKNKNNVDEMSEGLDDEVLDIEDEEVEDDEEASNDKKSKKKSKKSSSSSSQVSQKFCETIKNYLDNFAKENQFFAEKYSNPKKNINECCNFIISEVRKMNVQGLADDEVYYLARHYYEEENLKVDSMSGVKVVVNHKIELTEDEKKDAHEKALKDYEVAERQRIEKEAKAKAEKEAKAIERARIKAKQKAEKEKAENKQLSLFDLLGE